MNTRDTDIQKKGSSLIKLIILLALGLLIASYFFDFSLKKAIEDEQTQDNFSYVSEQSENFYTKHLKNTFDYLWYDVFVDLIWNSFIDNMGRIRDGGPTLSEETTSLIDPTIFESDIQEKNSIEEEPSQKEQEIQPTESQEESYAIN